MSYNAFKEINNKGEYYEVWFIPWFIPWFIFVGADKEPN